MGDVYVDVYVDVDVDVVCCYCAVLCPSVSPPLPHRPLPSPLHLISNTYTWVEFDVEAGRQAGRQLAGCTRYAPETRKLCCRQS